MSILDKVKDAASAVGAGVKGVTNVVADGVKTVTDAVTGGAAVVVLEHTGGLVPGGSVAVVVKISSTGGSLKSDGVAIDLYGEDDPDENILEKARELVTREGGPKHVYDVGEAFELEAGGNHTVTGAFVLPATLDPKLTWMIRARVKAFGNDPDTGWIRF